MRVGKRFERGSAPAEFVLVGALSSLLAIGIVQFAFVLYVRNTVSDAAAEGARFGVLEGSGAAAGAERTRDLVADAVGAAYAQSVRASERADGDVRIVEVIVECPLTLAGPLLPVASATLTGTAAQPMPMRGPSR